MDSHRFDKLTRALGGLERRQVLALVPATLAAALAGSEVKADKKDKRKRIRRRNRRVGRRFRRYQRKNSYLCASFENRVIRCPNDTVCCDPDRSNVSGCMPPGFSTCCQTADGYSGRNERYHCCSSVSEGFDGACRDDWPVCCPDDHCCPLGSDCSDLSVCARLVRDSASRHLVFPS